MQVPDVLSHAARRNPDRAALICGDRRVTFSAMDDRAGRLAAALLKVGVRRGDRVALLAPNVAEFLEIMVGVMRAGAILVPMNPRLTASELGYLIHDSSPALLLYDSGLEDVVSQLPVTTRWCIGESQSSNSYDQMLTEEAPATPDYLPSDAPSTIFYTSGTTGRPKGALVSHGAMYVRSLVYVLENRLHGDNVFLQSLPLFHVSSNVTFAFAHMGATNVLLSRFDPFRWLRAVKEHRVTHALVVPTMLHAILAAPGVEDADVSSLQLVLYGASPISPTLLERAMATLDCAFVQGYGMTEAGQISTLRAPDHVPGSTRLRSAGTTSISVETRIVDKEGHPTAPGQPGELLCRGPSLMEGYWQDDEATKRTMSEGWLRTGDVGYHDRAGYVFLTDRVGDVIVSGGENVYPREVEDILVELDDVLEAAVIGLDDQRWGERVHAVVVARADSGLSVEHVLTHCRARLAGYKTPKSVEFVATLPHSQTGKILRRLLRDERRPRVPR